MYLLCILLPLLNVLTLIFFGRYLGKYGSILFSNVLMLITFLFSLYIFYEIILCQSICTFKLWQWIISGSLMINWGFLFDSLTSIMLIVVTLVSFLVHLYSSNYMFEDPHIIRFISYLSLFTFLMLILISSDNFIQMFLGWEGVGLASYLLINFWHTRILANQAAMKAMIINRIGDFGLTLGIISIFIIFKTLQFPIIFSMVIEIQFFEMNFFGYQFDVITLISLLIFIGAIGKSAQIGLHTWLPDAMEGPTPVSALIHAATMVTAGVFVLLRCSPLLEFSNIGLFIITLVGAITAFMAASIGLVQNDIKKVIAYSTCSQLGYMVFSCGLSNYSVALFHLMNHAFFKALLFLSAGSIIHALSDEQDMRKMGGLLKLLPITYSFIFIGSLALMGFPFLTGFYSKDIILELSLGTFNFSAFFAYWLGLIGAFFTAAYSIRLIFLTFFNTYNGSKINLKYIHEGGISMLIPLFILSFGSIFVGYVFSDLFIGLGVETWTGVLFILPNHVNILNSEFLPFYAKLLPFFFSILGILFSLYVYKLFFNKIIHIKDYKMWFNFYNFLIKKWHFDNIYNYFIVNNILKIGYYKMIKLLDRGIIEWFGPYGIILCIHNIINKIVRLQTGLIYHYAFMSLLSLAFFILHFNNNIFHYILLSYTFIVFLLKEQNNFKI